MVYRHKNVKGAYVCSVRGSDDSPVNNLMRDAPHAMGWLQKRATVSIIPPANELGRGVR